MCTRRHDVLSVCTHFFKGNIHIRNPLSSLTNYSFSVSPRIHIQASKSPGGRYYYICKFSVGLSRKYSFVHPVFGLVACGTPSISKLDTPQRFELIFISSLASGQH